MAEPIVLSDRRARTRDDLLVAAQALLAVQTAGALGVRQITTAAGLAHGSFYNYYPSVGALIDDLAQLIFASQLTLVERLKTQFVGPASAFSAITRQTLRMVTDGPGYGRLLFDAGLPLDWFVSGMREAMKADIAVACQWGVFQVEDLDVTVSMLAGAITGAGIDLHRGVLKPKAIETVTARLLEMLGVGPEDARRFAFAEIHLVAPPPLPLRWRDMEAIHRQAARTG